MQNILHEFGGDPETEQSDQGKDPNPIPPVAPAQEPDPDEEDDNASDDGEEDEGKESA